MSRASTSHAAQFPADPKSRYFRPSLTQSERGRQGGKRHSGSPTRATRPKTLTCRNGAASQREFPSSRTLPRRVRTPQCALFPAGRKQAGRLKQSLAPQSKDCHPNKAQNVRGPLTVRVTKKTFNLGRKSPISPLSVPQLSRRTRHR